MGKRFFKPFKGKNYKKGINGKRVLVVGASFYCSKIWCKYFADCTSVEKKDSSPYDTKCPESGWSHLSDAPDYEINSMDERTYKTYNNFTNVMMEFTHTDTSEETWSYFAFTNYVQFFLPSEEGKYRPTLKSDLSERDFEAFNETLRELKPDVVIVWGAEINDRLKQQNEYLVDRKELEESEYYLCRIKLPDMDKEITLVNSYHPSCEKWWNPGIKDFKHYFAQAIGL